jgi:potassium-dependent mechanosensitive channel
MTVIDQILGLVFFFGWRDEVRGLWIYVKEPIDIGTFRISILQFVSGILIFALAIVLSRTISSFFERRMAKRAYLDVGLRYTIARLINYFILTIGVISALKAVGVDLTSIALLFTALSVGIGFGLQYLASDIASGFILLFERPIRVGDRITVGDNEEGDVHSIKLRTTTVFTNDRIAIIVPNSRLVSQRVINWSYGDPRARIAIPVGVSADSDIDLVTETLLLASEVENVLEEPPPKVQFMKFGEYSLDFRLLVWTREPSRHPQIRSDINYKIHRLFRERNIQIPYPVQELRLQTGDQSLKEALLKEDADSKPPAG